MGSLVQDPGMAYDHRLNHSLLQSRPIKHVTVQSVSFRAVAGGGTVPCQGVEAPTEKELEETQIKTIIILSLHIVLNMKSLLELALLDPS